MTRIIKLIVLVAIVVGFIVGIMFIPSIISIIRDIHDGGNGGSSDYIRLSNNIEQQWEQSEATWSIDDYNKLRADIDVCKKKLTGNNYSTLRQKNALAAVTVLHKSMMTAFEHNASETDIRKLKDDVAELKRDSTNQLEHNEKVKECEGTYKLYWDILKYGRTNFSFSPDLKVSENSVTFTKFSVHKDGVNKKVNGFKGNNYYQHLKDRTDVKTAFDKINEKLSAEEKKAYPDKVAKAIKDEFNNRDYTQENLGLLQDAYNKFREVGYSNDSLSDFLSCFKKEVKKKMENSPTP